MPKLKDWVYGRRVYTEVERLVDNAKTAVRSLFYYELKRVNREGGVWLTEGDYNSLISQMERLMEVRAKMIADHYEKKLKSEIQRVEDEHRMLQANPYSPQKPHQKNVKN